MRGAKPKVYPAPMVDEARRLYAIGMTQSEVAARLGTSQKVVFNVMRRAGIPRRLRVKRDQRGPNNDSWRGDAATYTALHARVISLRGQPQQCEVCGTTTARRYDWANLTGNYADPSDYQRMCRSCHSRFDGKAKNLGAYAVRKELPVP